MRGRWADQAVVASLLKTGSAGLCGMGLQLDTVQVKLTSQALSAKINANIERQMVNAASAGKLTIMKDKGGEE